MNVFQCFDRSLPRDITLWGNCAAVSAIDRSANAGSHEVLDPRLLVLVVFEDALEGTLEDL